MYPVLIPLPENRAGAKPFGPLFLELFNMMVRLGLARPHVQPCPRNFELRATSCELRANRNFGLFEARGLWPAALYLSSGNSVKDPGL
jgi:hypothetical protein